MEITSISVYGFVFGSSIQRAAGSIGSWNLLTAAAAAAAVAAAAAAAAEDSPRGPPDAAFAQAAIPLVRQFIKSRYKDYGQGKVAWLQRDRSGGVDAFKEQASCLGVVVLVRT